MERSVAKLIIAVALCGVSPLLMAQSELTIIDPEPNFASLTAVEINDAGKVLINRQRPAGWPTNPTQWGALWQEGVWTPLTIPSPIQSVCPQNTNYPTQYGNWISVRGGALNNNGTVAGGLLSGACSGNFMATWSGAGGISIARTSRSPDCGYPFPVSGGWFTALGDSGVAGGPSSAGCSGAGCYLTGTGGFLQDATSTNGIYTTVRDVNTNGVAVGDAQNGGGSPRGQLWTSPSTVTDIGPGTAVAINDLGCVLINGGIWQNGTWTTLNPPGTPASLMIDGIDLNDVGSALGTIAIRVDGARYNLAALGLSRPGYQNWQPVAINNRNWIVGNVTLADGTGRFRVWLFKPNLACFSITSQPAPSATCVGGSASFTIAVTGQAVYAYQWEIESSPGVWTALGSGPTQLPCGGSAQGTPSNSASTDITITPCPGAVHYRVRCVVSDACGSITSNPAALIVNGADFNGDGDLGTDSDIESFFACLGGTCCASCGTADFNGDGDIGTDADIESFFRVLAGGTC